MRIRPLRNFFGNFDLEYDVNFRQSRSVGLPATIDRSRFALQASWSRAMRLAVLKELRKPIRVTVRGTARLAVLPNRLNLLVNKYKMDPAEMKMADQKYGPLEWRLPEAHAIYWAVKGLENA